MILSSDWVRHKTKIVTIDMINHKAVQKIDKHQASRLDGVINLHSIFIFNT